MVDDSGTASSARRTHRAGRRRCYTSSTPRDDGGGAVCPAEKDMKIRSLAGGVAVLALGGSDAPTRGAAAGPIPCEALAPGSPADGSALAPEAVQAGGLRAPGPPDGASA